jgi:U4/U6.U5 tri-snRNP-associated protein 2
VGRWWLITLSCSCRRYARGVDGSDYMPGLIGLNNIKSTDFVNVVVQALGRIAPLRDFFLLKSNYEHIKSPLVAEFGALLCKMWSPYNFKGQVSPHELLQAVMHASNNRFRIGKQADPMDFLAWLLNALHSALGGTKKPGSSIIHRALQGKVRVRTLKAGTATEDNPDGDVEVRADAPCCPAHLLWRHAGCRGMARGRLASSSAACSSR